MTGLQQRIRFPLPLRWYPQTSGIHYKLDKLSLDYAIQDQTRLRPDFSTCFRGGQEMKAWV